MLHTVELFMSEHPWLTLILGMALPWITLFVLAGWVGSGHKPNRLAGTPRTPPDGDNVWGRVASRVAARIRDGRSLDPTGSVTLFLYSASLLSDDGERIRLEVESTALHQLYGWSQRRHGRLLKAALADAGRPGAHVVFETEVSPGVVWTWEPELGPPWPTDPPHSNRPADPPPDATDPGGPPHEPSAPGGAEILETLLEQPGFVRWQPKTDHETEAVRRGDRAGHPIDGLSQFTN